MDKINSKDSLQEYQKKMAHNRRVANQVKAILKRAKDADIPAKYMRIKQDAFEKLLDPHYHKDVEKFSNFVYKKPTELLKKEFIVIDGGGVVERKKALFAVLFRLIACDKYGSHWTNSGLSHLLRDTRASVEGMFRMDIIERLKSMDIVAISEILPKDFPTTFDTGRFYDDILDYRDDHVKTTILSFGHPLPKNMASEDPEKAPWVDRERFGQSLCSAGQSEQTKDSRFFRIRVKSNG